VEEVKEGGGVSLGWDSPVKDIVHPYYVNLEDKSGLGWLYSFNGWMVRCGVEWSGHPGDDNGNLRSLHGKISHIPANRVEMRVLVDGTLQLLGRVHEVWFKGANFEVWTCLSLKPNSTSFCLRDRVRNLSPKTHEFAMLYHANYGKPLLGKGARLFGTFETVQPFDEEARKDLPNWDVYQQPGYVAPGGERLYCVTPRGDEKGMAHMMLQNSEKDRGVAFEYKTSQLPYLSVWKNEDTESNGYVTGIEPGTGFPPNMRVERKAGRLATIGPNQIRDFEIKYTILNTAKQVEYVRGSIERINLKCKPPVLISDVLPKE